MRTVSLGYKDISYQEYRKFICEEEIIEEVKDQDENDKIEMYSEDGHLRSEL